MSPIMVGGDGSVAWKVEANNVREADSKLYPRPDDDYGPRKVVQQGIDETDDNQKFTITIKLPKDEAAARMFIDKLNDQAKRLPTSKTLMLELPIEDRRYMRDPDNRFGGTTNDQEEATSQQIVIDWPSRKDGTDAR
jgi:hypothetical protein